MIERIWHGYTTPEHADEYESLLLGQIIPDIADKAIPGYRGIRVLRRDIDYEVEFVTIMRFESLESVKAFVGEDYEVAHVPAAARQLLSRFDARSQHYDLRGQREY